MDSVRTHLPAVGCLLRALALALVACTIGVVGHAHASGGEPRWSVLIAGTLLVSSAGFATTGGIRLGKRALTAGVVGVQVVIHVVCTMLDAGATAATHAGHVAGHAHHAGVGAPASADPGHSMLAMLAMHLVATAAGVAMLWRIERLLWRPIRSATAAVARVVRSLVQPASRDHGCPGLLLHATETPPCRRIILAWLVDCAARRGPPSFVAI